MSLVALLSQRGSPGGTLSSLVLGGAWPAPLDAKAVLEADPAGGVLACRYRLGLEPGLVSLGGSSTHGLTVEQFWSHAQTLPGGLRVVVGPEEPSAAADVLSRTGAALGSWLRRAPVDVIADCGRLGHPAGLELATVADATLLVAAPVAEQLRPGAHRLEELRRRFAGPVGWLLVGEGDYRADEVQDAFGIPVYGQLPFDAKAAGALSSGRAVRDLARLPLMRAARGVAESLAGWLHQPAAETPVESPAPGEPADSSSAPVVDLRPGASLGAWAAGKEVG